MRRTSTQLAVMAVLAAVTAGCASDGRVEQRYPDKGRSTAGANNPEYGERETIFGEGGLTLFGGGRNRPEQGQTGGGIGVNAFLWRASLDTVAFMPLASADPFGGVIITDWYAPPEAPDERFKATVYILDRQLRADGVRVALFKQRRNGMDWVNADVDTALATELENRILARARELRVANRSG